MSSYQFLTLEIDGRIATVTLNQPERRNALSAGMIQEVLAVTREVNANRELSVMILTGAGKAFCAGGDVGNLRARLDDDAYRPMALTLGYRQGIQRLPDAFYELDIPVIAAVNGAAVGAGNDLAFFCDVRLATPWAKFGEIFLQLGAIPGDGGPWFLVRELGYQRAAYLTFTARIIGIEEAVRLKLVHKVVPPEELMPEARRLAETIAAKPPAALRATKQLLREADRTGLDPYLTMVGMAQALATSSPEHREALAARAEGRAPRDEGT